MPILLPAIPPEAIYPAQPVFHRDSNGELPKLHTKRKTPVRYKLNKGFRRTIVPLKMFLIKLAPRTSKVKLFQKALSCQPFLLQVADINDKWASSTSHYIDNNPWPLKKQT